MSGGDDADLVVVGGGPVGLVAALHARRAGLRTVVVEPRTAPVDKACGEGILPAGVAHLAALGVHPDGVVLGGIRYLDAQGRSAVAAFGGRRGLGVRRTVLHTELTRAALAAGVQVLPDRVVGFAQEDRVRVALHGGGAVHAPFVVAADGLHSPTRRLLGLDRAVRGPRRHGLRRHYAAAPWTDHVEVHWGPAGEAYVTPVAPDLVGVAILTDRVGSFDDLLAGFPLLAGRLAVAEVADAVRGAGPLRRRAARVVEGRVLLAGDAAGYVDAITGEGLTVGWAQARAAVAAVAAGEPGRYARRYPAIGAGGRLLTHALVQASRSPLVRRELVRVSAAAPALFRAAVVTAGSGH